MTERQERGGRRTGSADGERLVKSAYRVMQVFEFFSERRCPANATEIARGLGFPQSSTSMLLKSLTTLGYLEYQAESRTFRPTIRLSLLGGWVPERLQVADRLLALVRRLQEATGETILLGAQHRHFVRCIFVLPGPSEAGAEVPTGTLWPLCLNAMGHALLTLRSEAEVRGIVRRANAEEADAERRVSPGALLDRLERYRMLGYAATEEGSEAGSVSTLAMLLPAQEDGTRLSVAVTAPSGRLRAGESGMVRAMRELVARLERGGVPPGKRVAALSERREAIAPRSDLHLIPLRVALPAERRTTK